MQNQITFQDPSASLYQPPIIESSSEGVEEEEDEVPFEISGIPPQGQSQSTAAAVYTNYPPLNPNASVFFSTTEDAVGNDQEHFQPSQRQSPQQQYSSMEQSPSDYGRQDSLRSPLQQQVQVQSPQFYQQTSAPSLSFKQQYAQSDMPNLFAPNEITIEQQFDAPVDIHDDESYTDSDDEVPQSIQFETQPLMNRQSTTAPSRPFANRFVQNRNLIETQVPLRATANQGGITSWRDVKNIDVFLIRIYNYYRGKGLVNIILSEAANLISIAFIVFLSTFVFNCIDYSLIHSKPSYFQAANGTTFKRNLADVIVPQCSAKFGFFTNVFLLTFVAIWCIQAGRLFLDIPLLLEMQNFFNSVYSN
jgi:Autophagy protein ATG9